MVQSATVTLKAEVAKERGVDVTDYDLGASVGHAILNACRDHSRDDVTIDEIIEAAREVLALSDKVSAAIRGGTAPADEPAPAPEKPKTTRKPKETVKAPEPEPEPSVDFDDDIPF